MSEKDLRIHLRSTRKRIDGAPYPVKVYVAKLTAEDRIWEEQFTTVQEMQMFLLGVKAAVRVLGKFGVELPVVHTLPSGAVEITNPREEEKGE